MSIAIIVGSPGAGKSYEAVAFHILPAVRQGRKVITNIPLNLSHFRKVDPGFDLNLIDVLEPTDSRPIRFRLIDDFVDDWKSPSGLGPLYVIDECHNAFPRSVRGADAKENEEKVFAWITMSRHRGVDMVLITQQAGQMKRDIPGLAEVYYILQKNRMVFGSSRTYRQTAKDGFGGKVIGTTVRRYDKNVFPYYKSQSLGGGAEGAVQVKPIWFKWYFLCFYVLVVYNIYVALFTDRWHHVLTFGTDDVKAEAVEKPKPVVALVPPPDTELARKVDLSLPAPVVAPAAPAVPEPPPEPKNPSVSPGFDPRQVVAVEWARLGKRCNFFLKLGSGQRLAPWQVGQAGWKVVMHVNEGEDRERDGSCSVDFVREIEGTVVVASFYSNPLQVFTIDTLEPLDKLPEAVVAVAPAADQTESDAVPSLVAPPSLVPATPVAESFSIDALKVKPDEDQRNAGKGEGGK